MARWLIYLCIVAGVLAGCKKNDASSLPQTADSAADPSAPASPRGPAPEADGLTNALVIADSGDVIATLAQLTRELRDYVVRTRSVPKNFDEFAAKSQVQFPAPPAGKKYAIDGQAVVLAKR